MIGVGDGMMLPAQLQKSINLAAERERQREQDALAVLLLEKQRSGEAIRKALEHDDGTEVVRNFTFHSSVGEGPAVGSINLGNHKRHIGKYVPFKDNMAYHSDGKRPIHPNDTSHMVYTPSFQSGLSTTKFSSGFMRRQESNVFNPLKDAEAAQKIESENRKELLRQNRKIQLDKNRFGNGFNLINNQEVDRKLIESRADPPRGKKFLQAHTSHESIINGMNALKDGMGRFHYPHGSGDFFESRQETLYREGTHAKKMTRVLGSLIPSSGI